MKTTPAICYAPWEMKPSYAEDFAYNNDSRALYPLDFGALDAPDIIAAGSMYPYELSSKPGNFIAMQNHISRP